jgi:putative membrane protein
MTFRATFAVSFMLALVLGINLLVAAQSDKPSTQEPAATTAATQSLASSDREFIMHVAHNGMMEIDLANLALQKSANEDVKRFAQRLIDDHKAANEKLMTLAQSKGITLPDPATVASTSQTNEGSRQSANIETTRAAQGQQSTDAKFSKAKEKLGRLSGAEFDREYMKMMVKDHEKAVAEFQKQSTQSKDTGVQEFARTTLPTLQEHLTMARDIESKVSGKTGGR